jgi:hypothetical protein
VGKPLRTRALAYDTSHMTRDELLATIQIAGTETDVECADGYIDFGTVDGQRRCFEVSGDGDTAQLWMDRKELSDLVRKLSIVLLADA